GLWDSEAEFGHHGIVEILVVRRPPEGIVDDVSSLQRCVLQVAAVIFDFVGNAVDDDLVFRRLVHLRAAELHEVGGDAVFLSKLVNLVNKRRRKTEFTPAQQTDFRHGSSLCFYQENIKSFLQGLKPVENPRAMSGLKPRPPEEKAFCT